MRRSTDSSNTVGRARRWSGGSSSPSFDWEGLIGVRLPSWMASIARACIARRLRRAGTRPPHTLPRGRLDRQPVQLISASLLGAAADEVAFGPEQRRAARKIAEDPARRYFVPLLVGAVLILFARIVRLVRQGEAPST